MSHPPPDQHGPADGSNDPAAEQISRIASAIESYTRERKTTDADGTEQNHKIHWWARVSAIAVIIYTLITIAVFVASIRSIQETRRATYYARRSAEAAI